MPDRTGPHPNAPGTTAVMSPRARHILGLALMIVPLPLAVWVWARLPLTTDLALVVGIVLFGMVVLALAALGIRLMGSLLDDD